MSVLHPTDLAALNHASEDLAKGFLRTLDEAVTLQLQLIDRHLLDTLAEAIYDILWEPKPGEGSAAALHPNIGPETAAWSLRCRSLVSQPRPKTVESIQALYTDIESLFQPIAEKLTDKAKSFAKATAEALSQNFKFDYSIKASQLYGKVLHSELQRMSDQVKDRLRFIADDTEAKNLMTASHEIKQLSPYLAELLTRAQAGPPIKDEDYAAFASRLNASDWAGGPTVGGKSRKSTVSFSSGGANAASTTARKSRVGSSNADNASFAGSPSASPKREPQDRDFKTDAFSLARVANEVEGEMSTAVLRRMTADRAKELLLQSFEREEKAWKEVDRQREVLFRNATEESTRLEKLKADLSATYASTIRELEDKVTSLNVDLKKERDEKDKFLRHREMVIALTKKLDVWCVKLTHELEFLIKVARSRNALTKEFEDVEILLHQIADGLRASTLAAAPSSGASPRRHQEQEPHRAGQLSTPPQQPPAAEDRSWLKSRFGSSPHSLPPVDAIEIQIELLQRASTISTQAAEILRLKAELESVKKENYSVKQTLTEIQPEHRAELRQLRASLEREIDLLRTKNSNLRIASKVVASAVEREAKEDLRIESDIPVRVITPRVGAARGDGGLTTLSINGLALDQQQLVSELTSRLHRAEYKVKFLESVALSEGVDPRKLDCPVPPPPPTPSAAPSGGTPTPRGEGTKQESGPTTEEPSKGKVEVVRKPQGSTDPKDGGQSSTDGAPSDQKEKVSKETVTVKSSWLEGIALSNGHTLRAHEQRRLNTGVEERAQARSATFRHPKPTSTATALEYTVEFPFQRIYETAAPSTPRGTGSGSGLGSARGNGSGAVTPRPKAPTRPLSAYQPVLRRFR
jgi:hypothetical protein